MAVTRALLLLFLSSYLPLFVVFALLDSFGKGWPTGACLILAALGLVALPLVFLVTHNLEPQRLKAETSQVLAASQRDHAGGIAIEDIG